MKGKGQIQPKQKQVQPPMKLTKQQQYKRREDQSRKRKLQDQRQYKQKLSKQNYCPQCKRDYRQKVRDKGQECRYCMMRQRQSERQIKKILIDQIAAQIKLQAMIKPVVILPPPQVHIPQPQVNIPQPQVNVPEPKVDVPGQPKIDNPPQPQPQASSQPQPSSKSQQKSQQKREIKQQDDAQKKQKLLSKKDHHGEQQASGKDVRQLDIDSYVVETGKTRKGLYVNQGINIGGICENSSCQAFNSLVYYGLTNKQPWNIPRIIEETYCPVCKSNIGTSIKTIAYYNCSWKIVGKIKGETKSFKIQNKTNKKEVSQYLPSDKVSEVQFAYLVLEAQPL